LGYFVKEL